MTVEELEAANALPGPVLALAPQALHAAAEAHYDSVEYDERPADALDATQAEVEELDE
jgi:hypothetical protein